MDNEKYFEIFKFVLSKEYVIKEGDDDEVLAMADNVKRFTDIVYDMYTTKDLNND